MSKKHEDKGPPYRRHRDKRRNRAFVELGGRRIYLGPWNSPESHVRFAREVAEWEASGKDAPAVGVELTVGGGLRQVLGARPGVLQGAGRQPRERAWELPHSAAAGLKELYGDVPRQLVRAARPEGRAKPAHREGPDAAQPESHGWTDQAGFRWAASEQIVSVAVPQARDTVEGRERGRSAAREAPPVQPVGEGAIFRRPTRSGSTAPRGTRQRTAATSGPFYLGPRSQEILRPFLRDCGMQEYVFSPRRAEARRRAASPAPATGEVAMWGRPKNKDLGRLPKSLLCIW